MVLATTEASDLRNDAIVVEIRSSFVTIEQRTRTLVDRPRDSVDAYVTDEQFDRAWYTDRRYMEEWSPADRRWTEDRLDAAAVDKLNYRLSDYP